MASKTTLNAKNLEALGAERLAELLIEISAGSAAHKRRLRQELAGSQSTTDLAREVRKRLSSIQRARTFINWRKVKAIKVDLETQRSLIANTITLGNPTEAMELIWQFLGLADSIFERSDDGSGTLIESFHKACADVGRIAKSASANGPDLAGKVFGALKNNGYGQYDHLIKETSPALGETGLKHLAELFKNWMQEPEHKPADRDRAVMGWSTNGAVYEDEIYADRRDITARVALRDIADAQDDVDAYIAQQPENARQSPRVAAEIAARLLSADRADEALTTLDQVEIKGRLEVPFEWQQVRVDALEALGRAEEAQNYRWQCFEQTLNEAFLRSFIKRLPDFDDIEAEEKAFAFAHTFPDVHNALAFFVRWPALGEAAKLVVKRRKEFDGDYYQLLSPVADELQGMHPLAATLILRSMIDFTLGSARSGRYKHAARHLVECGSLSTQIDSFGELPSHEDYAAQLRRAHGKKHGFWTRVHQLSG
ncbi:hypothetical protein HB779_07025 [Phyllobacterium sp. 628]|uniref:DUF6880 family protein n=1 Tax=Phyllobacterium sp. 628 TaxID=2718938 RepID=UPI00166239D5|nr:DUF6880 family protein [Phyllobacterium sp. 628]QND51679.1 hypothetical protein HB779_07025 [Phyllobacterium sp. 628]